MRTHVVILAQGSQQRMGKDLVVPKQLLDLPAHRAAQAPNTTILGRTLMQVAIMLAKQNAYARIELVAKETLERALPTVALGGNLGWFRPMCATLDDPGNSALLGVQRFLAGPGGDAARAENHERIVVLLGDVVYSWACLRALLCKPTTREVTFVGTPDLSPGAGELFGISWYRTAEQMMAKALVDAVGASSKVEDDYQPGQLRHWLWAVDAIQNSVTPLLDRKGRRWKPGEVAGDRKWYVPIEDYTMDVDLPEHLADLANSSLQALVDDKENVLRG